MHRKSGKDCMKICEKKKWSAFPSRRSHITVLTSRLQLLVNTLGKPQKNSIFSGLVRAVRMGWGGGIGKEKKVEKNVATKLKGGGVTALWPLKKYRLFHEKSGKNVSIYIKRQFLGFFSRESESGIFFFVFKKSFQCEHNMKMCRNVGQISLLRVHRTLYPNLIWIK